MTGSVFNGSGSASQSLFSAFCWELFNVSKAACRSTRRIIQACNFNNETQTRTVLYLQHDSRQSSVYRYFL